VQATGEDAELRFNTAHTTEEEAGLFDGPDGQPELPQLSFTMEGNDEKAALGFSFGENGRPGYDRADAYLLESLSDSYVQLFTKTENGEPLVINNLPLEAQELNLPLFVDASQNGDMTLSLSGMQGMEDGWSITLTDNMSGSTFTVDEGFEYDFRYEASNSGKRQAINTAKASAETPFNLAAPRVATPDKNMEARFTLNIVYGTPTSTAPGGELPEKMQLSQNYPNPFNPSTRIDFALPEQAEVRLDVFDLMGRRVATVLSETRPAGEHSVMFDASNLASGVYLYRLQAAGEIQTQKMTIIK